MQTTPSSTAVSKIDFWNLFRKKRVRVIVDELIFGKSFSNFIEEMMKHDSKDFKDIRLCRKIVEVISLSDPSREVIPIVSGLFNQIIPAKLEALSSDQKLSIGAKSYVQAVIEHQSHAIKIKRIFLTTPLNLWNKSLTEDAIRKSISQIFSTSEDNSLKFYNSCKHLQVTLFSFFCKRVNASGLRALLALNQQGDVAEFPTSFYKSLPDTPQEVEQYLASKHFKMEVFLQLPIYQWISFFDIQAIHDFLKNIIKINNPEEFYSSNQQSTEVLIKLVNPDSSIIVKILLGQLQHATRWKPPINKTPASTAPAIFTQPVIANQEEIRINAFKQAVLNQPIKEWMQEFNQDFHHFLATIYNKEFIPEVVKSCCEHPHTLLSWACKNNRFALLIHLFKLDKAQFDKLRSFGFNIPFSYDLEVLKKYFESGEYKTSVYWNIPLVHLSDWLQGNVQLGKYKPAYGETFWQASCITKQHQTCLELLKMKAKASGKSVTFCIFDRACKERIDLPRAPIDLEDSILLKCLETVWEEEQIELNSPLDPNDPYSIPVWKAYGALWPLEPRKDKDGDFFQNQAPLKLINFLLSQKKEINWNINVKGPSGNESLLHYLFRKHQKNYLICLNLRDSADNPIILTAFEIITHGLNPYIHRDAYGVRAIDWLIYWFSPRGNARLQVDQVFLPSPFPTHWDKSVYLRFSNAAEDLCEPLQDYQHFGSHIWQKDLPFKIILAAMHHPKYRPILFRDFHLLNSTMVEKLGLFLQNVFVSKEQYVSILQEDFHLSLEQIPFPETADQALECFLKYGCLPDNVLTQFIANFSSNQLLPLTKGMKKVDLKEVIERRWLEVVHSIQTRKPWMAECQLMRQSTNIAVDLMRFLQGFYQFRLNARSLFNLMKIIGKTPLNLSEEDKALKNEILNNVITYLPKIEEYISSRLKSLDKLRTEVLKNLNHEFLEPKVKEIFQENINLISECNRWIQLLTSIDLSKEVKTTINNLQEQAHEMSRIQEKWLRDCENERKKNDPLFLDKEYADNDSALLITNLVGSIQENSMNNDDVTQFLGIPFAEIYDKYHIVTGRDLKAIGVDIRIESICDQFERAFEPEVRKQKFNELLTAIEERKQFLISLMHQLNTPVPFKKAIDQIDLLFREDNPNKEGEGVSVSAQKILKWDRETRGLMLKAFFAQPGLKNHFRVLEKSSLSEWIAEWESVSDTIPMLTLYNFGQFLKENKPSETNDSIFLEEANAAKISRW